MNSDSICLYVSVPIACFRAPYARTFAESLPVPAPSTVYGMLLSMIGEKDRDVYKGAKIAIGLLSAPERSTVLRKMWKVKFKPGSIDQSNKRPAKLGSGSNSIPDFQELLSGVELLVWIQKGEEDFQPSLKEKIEDAMKNPKSISRFGSLSLGESTHLVNDISWAREKLNSKFQLLRPVAQGQLSLPIWVDHVGSFHTKWMQFDLEDDCTKDKINHEIFVTIAP